MTDLHPFLIFHYQNYANNKGFMTFENIFEFYKDFEIFPDIIPLWKIKEIFECLSEKYSSEEFIKTNLNKTKCKINNKNNFEIANDINETNTFTIDGRINFQKTKIINYNLFLQSLAISAMFFKFNEKFSNIDKVS